jgi:hypothetical protein
MIESLLDSPINVHLTLTIMMVVKNDIPVRIPPVTPKNINRPPKYGSITDIKMPESESRINPTANCLALDI